MPLQLRRRNGSVTPFRMLITTVSEESPAIRLSILTVGQAIALTTFLKICSTPVAL